MNEKLDQFSRKADGADIAFIYYSGHGMQFNGFNYFLPKDASLDNAADVNPFRLVRIDTVMETLSGVKGPKIVVLDACRDNPVANELKRKLAALRGARGAEVTRGLSPISAGSVSGLLVAYATQPDDTAFDGKGRNSPFTAAFIKNVGDPDTDIRQMFFHVQDEVVRETDGKQRPEISVSLVGEYKLKITITPVNPSETLPPTATPAAPVSGGAGDAERTWGYVKDTASPKVLEDFIHRFPDTIFAELAREKLEELKKKTQVAAIPAQAETSIVQKTLGLELSSLTDDVRRKFRIRDDLKGVVVIGVDPSVASDAPERHLQPGDVIVEVQYQGVLAPADVQKRIDDLKSKRTKFAVLLLSDADGDTRFVALPLQ